MSIYDQADQECLRDYLDERQTWSPMDEPYGPTDDDLEDR